MGREGSRFAQMDDCVIDSHIVVSFVKIAYITRQGFTHLLLLLQSSIFPNRLCFDLATDEFFSVQILDFDVYNNHRSTIFSFLLCVVSIQRIIKQTMIQMILISFENLEYRISFFALDVLMSFASKFFFC